MGPRQNVKVGPTLQTPNKTSTMSTAFAVIETLHLKFSTAIAMCLLPAPFCLLQKGIRFLDRISIDWRLCFDILPAARLSEAVSRKLLLLRRSTSLAFLQSTCCRCHSGPEQSIPFGTLQRLQRLTLATHQFSGVSSNEKLLQLSSGMLFAQHWQKLLSQCLTRCSLVSTTACACVASSHVR